MIMDNEIISECIWKDTIVNISQNIVFNFSWKMIEGKVLISHKNKQILNESLRLISD